MRNPWTHAAVGFAWGLALFLGLGWLLKHALGPARSESPALSQFVFKTSMVLVSLIAWRLSGRPFHAMGWRGAGWRNRAYLVPFAISAGSMMAASVGMILLGTRHPLASRMSFLEIVLLIWVLSSVSEEVYVRGLVQSWIVDRDGADGTHSPFEPPIVASALLFAAMHAPLMWSPAGFKGGLVIVLATLGVGLACAILRARTASLWPAIACHVLGNMAAIPGGILGVIIYRLIHGRLPEMLVSG